MSDTEANEIIRIIRLEVECAVDVILTEAERSLKDLGAAREGAPVRLDAFESSLSKILEACAFQDITGQRLSKLDAIVTGASSPPHEQDSLLEGPALSGRGLDQAAADLLLQGTRF